MNRPANISPVAESKQSLEDVAIKSAVNATELILSRNPLTRPDIDLLAWSVTPEGYNDRVQSLLGIIKAKTSWQHLCSRRNEADDEADDDLRQLRSLERSINMACNGPAR